MNDTLRCLFLSKSAKSFNTIDFDKFNNFKLNEQYCVWFKVHMFDTCF